MDTDDDLIARAKLGDTGAWRELYRAHAGRLVVWLGARASGDAAVTAEDVAADAWLTAAEKISDFQGNSDDFAGWLFGIARRHSANTARRSRRRSTEPVGAHAPDHAGDHRVESHEAAIAAGAWVTQLLATLPGRERDVVACLDVVGLDVETTARALGISAVAVRVAHHRGLRKLRRPPAEPVHASSDDKRSR